MLFLFLISCSKLVNPEKNNNIVARVVLRFLYWSSTFSSRVCRVFCDILMCLNSLHEKPECTGHQRRRFTVNLCTHAAGQISQIRFSVWVKVLLLIVFPISKPTCRNFFCLPGEKTSSVLSVMGMKISSNAVKCKAILCLNTAASPTTNRTIHI